jgi:hypothetical protein
MMFEAAPFSRSIGGEYLGGRAVTMHSTNDDLAHRRQKQYTGLNRRALCRVFLRELLSYTKHLSFGEGPTRL